MSHSGTRGDRPRLVCVVVLAAFALAACSSDSKGAADTSAPTVTPAEASTTQPTPSPTTAVPTTTTEIVATTVPPTTRPATTEPATTVPPTTAPATTAPATTIPVTTIPATTAPAITIATDPGPLEFVDGKLLGIAQGTELAFATAALGLTAVRLNDVEFDPPVSGCTGTPDPLVIRTGGLTLVFEAFEGEEPVLSNWTYTGGPAAGFTEIVAPFGIHIGDPRSKLEAANPGFLDLRDQIDVYEPFYLRYDVENDVVNWFGIIDCLFETEGEGA